jgi:hypothetical protein
VQQLAFSGDYQHLYMTRSRCGGFGDVVEIDRDDGHVLRTVAQGMVCATGLAVDPQSGDLFVSGPCPDSLGTNFVYRVADPQGASPFVTIFAEPGRASGLRFDENGTLYGIVRDGGSMSIVRMDRRSFGAGDTGTGVFFVGPDDPLYHAVALVPAASNGTTAATRLFYVLLADGGVRAVDLRTTPPTVTTVVQGGNNAVALIPGNIDCLYFSTMDQVIRVSAFDGSCNMGVVSKPADSVAKEYYNTTLGHYFITAFDAEKTSVESGGAGPGWIATGYYFDVGGNGSVCRFYGNRSINPATGKPYGPNSHFYTIEPAECAAVKQDPGWVFESPRVFALVPVSAPGACPFGSRPIFRVYNNRALQNDSNHRYTADTGVYQQMIAGGWRAEGVVFCSQQ